MTIEAFVDKINVLEFKEVKNKTLEEILKYIRDNKFDRLYIVDGQIIKYIFDYEKILDIFFSNLLQIKFIDFYKKLKNCDFIVIDASRHIIDTYNYMRSLRLLYAPVVKDGNIIGEINFSTLSLKISYLAIKDKITNVFNEKYFNVLIDEYQQINKIVGIIMIKIFDVDIFESFYGKDFVNGVLKEVALVIKNSIRDVDFIFRNDNIFKILTFNNAEITMKIKKRIDDKLKSLKIDDIKISYKIVATHIPEIDDNILIGIEKLEKKLIKRD